MEYAKQYIAFLSSVPSLLNNGGSEALEKVQSELGDSSMEVDRTQGRSDIQNDDSDSNDIYCMPQFQNGVAIAPSRPFKNFRVYGNKSLQHGSDFIRRLLEKQWRTRTNDQQQQSMRVINSVKAEVFQLLEQLSRKELKMPKTSPHLMHFLANIVELMTNITYLIKSDRDYLVQNVRTFIMAFVSVAKSIPVNNCDLRRKHFLMFNNFVFYSNKLQLLGNKPLIDQIALNMDSLIEERVLHSTGPITKNMIDV